MSPESRCPSTGPPAHDLAVRDARASFGGTSRLAIAQGRRALGRPLLLNGSPTQEHSKEVEALRRSAATLEQQRDLNPGDPPLLVVDSSRALADPIAGEPGCAVDRDPLAPSFAECVDRKVGID